MKRLAILLTLSLLTVGRLWALHDVFDWGVTAGANISKADSHGAGFMGTGWNFDSSGGYYLGFTSRINLPITGVAFDASFVYSQEMADIGSNGVSVAEKLRYFSIPLHVRYDFDMLSISEAFLPYVFMGPQCNLKLNDFDWYALARKDESMREKLDETMNNMTSDRTWKWDFGFGVILGGRIQLAYNYAFPLNHSFHLQTTDGVSDSAFRMGTHLIGLTYFF